MHSPGFAVLHVEVEAMLTVLHEYGHAVAEWASIRRHAVADGRLDDLIGQVGEEALLDRLSFACIICHR
jgi:hypothetical protein